MRTISPLDEQEWDVLVKDLERGPTDEQIAFIRKAIKQADTLVVSYDD